MTHSATLTIDFTGFWLSGTGTARGRHLDVVTHRDRDGCPAMPMSQIKGQLRETAERLAEGSIGGWNAKRVNLYFGEKDKTPSAIAFSGDAVLDAGSRAYFSDKINAQDLALLFRRISATAMNEAGVAKDFTLRAVEAVVPLTLTATLRWIGTAPPDAKWREHLDLVSAATLAFGKQKSDGYGRAIARVGTK